MVLSSVRKLVSTDSTAGDGRARPEKLLLTPAFRVDDGIDEPAVEKPEPRRTPTFFRSPRRYTSLEGRIAELERAVGGAADEFEPDGSEDTDEETPKRFVFQHRVRSDMAAEEPIGSMIVGADPASVDDEDTPEIQVYVSPKAEPEDVAESLTETVEVITEDPETSTALDTHLDGMIDEAALREIVAQMVRAELQGELGEKITRNVRKLVRREIHRVLLTHDFG